MANPAVVKYPHNKVIENFSCIDGLARAATTTATITADPADWRTAFNNAYALKPDQNLKFLPPPPLPERQRYLQETEGNDNRMPFIQWRWSNGRIKREWFQSSGLEGVPISSVLATCMDLDAHHISLDGIPSINANGDWIVRDGATTAAILADLQNILTEHFKVNIHVEKTEIVKNALIVSGKYHLHRLPEATQGDLQIFTDVMDHPKDGDAILGGGTTKPHEFWTMMGGQLNIPIVDESTREPRELNWFLSRPIDNQQNDPARHQKILDNIAVQTGLSFKQEDRTFTLWKFTVLPNRDPVIPPYGTEK